MPLLEQERELELARLWRQEQNEKALHELTSAHLRLVIAMATKFRHYGLPMGDLYKRQHWPYASADRFDIERGVRFSTYASWWIRASIRILPKKLVYCAYWHNRSPEIPFFTFDAFVPALMMAVRTT